MKHTSQSTWQYSQVLSTNETHYADISNRFIRAHLANGTTILGIILVSDHTHLTNFTGDKMHAVYLSIGNISKDVCWKHNSCAWLLVTKIPISKFSKTQFSGPNTEQEAMPGILSHCLFHECMWQVLAPLQLDQRQYYVVPSPDGNSWLCMAVLMAWIADLEEQLLILGVQHLSCPVCTAVYHNLAETDGCGVHMGEVTISALKEVWCRQDISSVSNPPIGTSFGPQNIPLPLQAKNPTTGMLFWSESQKLIFHMHSKLRHNYVIKCA